jgi:hypothetical protein
LYFSFFFQNSEPERGQIDIQVQALFGDFDKVHEGSIGALMLGVENYNFYFNGTTSDWSNTKTISVPDGSVSSSTSSTPSSSSSTSTPDQTTEPTSNQTMEPAS